MSKKGLTAKNRTDLNIANELHRQNSLERADSNQLLDSFVSHRSRSSLDVSKNAVSEAAVMRIVERQLRSHSKKNTSSLPVQDYSSLAMHSASKRAVARGSELKAEVAGIGTVNQLRS